MSKRFFQVLGPSAFLIVNFWLFPELDPQIRAVLAVTLWMAIWWISEAIPIEVTALIPIVLFPATGTLDVSSTTTTYFSPIVVLFMGGFFLAIAIEKCGLHRRIALSIISRVGSNNRRLVLGFMLATFALSMWISNTATTLMMLPIALSIVVSMEGFSGFGLSPKFSRALMLAIAYSASIGGMATLIGTPTNAIFSGVIGQTYGFEVSFSRWMLFGFPLSFVLLIAAWQLIVWKLPVGSSDSLEHFQVQDEVKRELKALGRASKQERLVILVFSLTAIAWITRTFLIKPILPMVDDTSIAIAGAIALFIIPVKGEPLLIWEDAKRLPWGILLVFGGGLALAQGFESSGLGDWLAGYLGGLGNWPLLILLVLVVLSVNFFTEITSNVATVSVVLPVLASLSKSIDVHPVGLMMGACLAASCAFMLPVATPPNAIVFGSGKVTMREMVRAGFLLNLISSLLIVLFIYWVLPLIWQIDLFSFPF